MNRRRKRKGLLASLPRGHEWGQGRPTLVHGDRRTKRARSRGDQRRKALREALEE